MMKENAKEKKPATVEYDGITFRDKRNRLVPTLVHTAEEQKRVHMMKRHLQNVFWKRYGQPPVIPRREAAPDRSRKENTTPGYNEDAPVYMLDWEAEQHLGLTRWMLHQGVNSGHLSPIRKDHKSPYLYDVDQLKAFVAFRKASGKCRK